MNPEARHHKAESQDFTTELVPLTQRRGPLTLGLLWLTMVTGFPSVLIGFDWYKQGFTMLQIIQCMLISGLILLAYSIPSCYLGARSGQTYGLLSRSVFGRWGSWLVSFNLLWVSIAWYALNAIFLADGLKGLFHWNIPLVGFAAFLAVVMAFNNFFGFSGVANFARFIAAPVLIVWVGCTFFKAAGACPASVLSQPAHLGFGHALTVVSSFLIGYSVWGNEADYWRYGKAKISHSLIPLVISISVGQMIFPATGWMIARMSGITNYAQATDLMNHYSFGGFTIAAAFVLAVSYFAVNDSGLYGAINAQENIKELPRQKVVFGLMLAGVISSILLSGNPHAFELVTSLSCVFLPSATVVMMGEWFVVDRILGRQPDFSRVPSLSELERCRWPAVTALAAGCTVGVITSGIIPGLESLHVGVCSLQAWITALAVYIPWRLAEHAAYVKRHQTLESLLPKAVESESSVSR